MGFAGEGVVGVLLTAASGERAGSGPLGDGWFAISGRLDGPMLGAGRPEVEAFDQDGGLIWRRTFPSTVQPAECMTSEEEGHGC